MGSKPDEAPPSRRSAWRTLVPNKEMAVGLLALVLALQANRLAQDANRMTELSNRDNLEIIEVEPESVDFDEGEDGPITTKCVDRLRIWNAGGAQAVIVRWGVVLSYLNSTKVISSTTGGVVVSRVDELWGGAGIRAAGMMFADRRARTAAGKLGFVLPDMPVVLDDHAVWDYYARVVVFGNDDGFEIPPNPRQSPSDTVYSGWSPLEVSYFVETASGVRTEAGQRRCVWMRALPSSSVN